MADGYRELHACSAFSFPGASQPRISRLRLPTRGLWRWRCAIGAASSAFLGKLEGRVCVQL